MMWIIIAGRIEKGKGNDVLGILCHVDVVPAGDGFHSKLFDPVVMYFQMLS